MVITRKYVSLRRDGARGREQLTITPNWSNMKPSYFSIKSEIPLCVVKEGMVEYGVKLAS